MTRGNGVALILGLMLALSGATADAVPMGPPEMIALIDAHPERRINGVYTMTVAAAERRPNALYLNSSTDYRAPDDVTFHLTPSAAKTLEKRMGSKPETTLIGKTIVVRGELRAIPIANMFSGRPRSLNRYQHTVLVSEARLVSIE